MVGVIQMRESEHVLIDAEILSVQKGASKAEIKKAYHKVPTLQVVA